MTLLSTYLYCVAESDLYARHVAIRERAYHPTGQHLPVTKAESALTPLHRWLRMVELFGANRALEEQGRTLTYAALNREANRIAHAILGRRVPRDLPVAILLDLEWDLPLAILAIWKAGYAFVLLESRQPLARNQYIVEESGAPIIVTNRNQAQTARQLCRNADDVIVIEELDEHLPTDDPPITIDGASPAYLMYTSGSTGKPKGTVELHRNLMQMMMERTNCFHFSTHDRVALLVLGGGCYTLLCALMYGGCLLPFRVRDEGLTRLTKWVIEQRITVLLDAAMLREWLLTLDVSEQFPDVRVLILGAGPTYREHVAAFQRYLPASCVLANLYAATEVRSIALLFIDHATRLETRLVPVGFAPEWATIEIWDEQDNPLPRNAVGEIVVFTPYAAAGYWQSPELSEAKWGVDKQGRRFCRMGDLGRLDEQDCLWVLGRKDGQLKIRDNRVETAEIEVALLEIATVLEAAVVHLGEAGAVDQLVAFVAADSAVTGVELRKQLATRLPDYMLPAIIIVQDELPRNDNGKVARPLLRQMAMAFAQQWTKQ